MRCHHEGLGLHDCLQRERHVNRHLVAVKVGIVSGTNKGVHPDGIALNQDRFEGLNGETVQGGSTVQEDGVPLGDFLQDVPNFR